MNSGKVSESVLKRSVLKYVTSKHTEEQGISLLSGAKSGADCALFAIPGQKHEECCRKAGQETGTAPDIAAPQSGDGLCLASATAVMVGRRRTLLTEAMTNACNNLICGGAEAFGVQLAVVLPEEMYESELKHMMEEARAYASAHHITILGGHTEVRSQVLEAVVTVTALGRAADYKTGTAKPGMDIVMSKWIGLQGTAQIAAAHKEALEKRLPIRFVAEAAGFGAYMSVVPEARIAMAHGACLMHDVSGGGIFRALWELAEIVETGISIELKKIPVKQETIEVCEVFGLNPYELLSGGALLMVTEDGEGLCESLWEAGIAAAVIGRLTDNNDKVILNRSSEGEEVRYLDRPRTDEIDKVIRK